ncbi:MAG: hypothetical protein R3209_02525 [Salinimicrobium sediminis]|nr:hypothetical protein [Salinimicrobium sediminis]
MKFFFSLLILLLGFTAAAQKHTTHVIEAGDLEKIVLSSDEIYSIKISTHPGTEVRIVTDTEGEYYDDINLEVERRNQTLFLKSRFREILQSGYDKLSAHKVFSMEVELEIPENLVVEVNSNVASVFLTGSYESVLIQLKTGSCYFENFEGAAVVNTYEGNILGSARNFTSEANSRHGQVEVPQNSHGIHKMVLTSINGDIKLTETK